jgi:hypothetical protein
MNKNTTIIINSCDDYADALYLFFLAWDKYYPNLNNEIIISSETRAHNFNAKTVTYIPDNGVDNWGSRIKQAVIASETEYVLVTYDDFILDDYASGAGLDEAVNILEKDPCAAVVYLVDTKLDTDNSFTSSNDRFVKILDRAPFKLNSSPGIWRKTDFIDFTKSGDTPWAWEAFGTYRTQRRNKNFYTLAPGVTPIYPYDNSQGGAIYRGKWVASFVKKFEINFNVDIDWSHRGFACKPSSSKRSILWKIKFMLTGFRMVGFHAFHFIFLAISTKLNVKR